MAAADQNLNLQERLSYVHSNPAKDGEYTDAKTPTELEGGALVAGGELNFMSLEAMGLFSCYGAIGIVYGMIPYLQYPLFMAYLNMEGYQTSSYRVLVLQGWSFKVIFGMLSDCFPIFGYRRKSWILIGWAITAVCCSIMAFSPLGEPYCNREKFPDKAGNCDLALVNVSQADQDLMFNFGAPDKGSMYIILSMLVSLGYVMAACASDGMVVEYAQREPESTRGRVLAAIYTVRTMTSIISSIIVGFGLSSPNYGGEFDFSIGPNVPYFVCLVPCVLVVLSTLFLLVEVKKPATPVGEWWNMFWNLLQERVMWQICAFRFINNVFNSMYTVAEDPVKLNWAKVTPFNGALFDVLGSLAFSATLVLVGKWGMQWNWRYIIAIGTIGVIAIDSIIVNFTIWDVVRNQYFWVGGGLSVQIPEGVRFIIATFCAVEVADVGVEGATYGLITTMNNMASPIATVMYKYINSYFMVKNDAIKSDTTEVRWDVTYVYIISYAARLFALVFLVMLPPQKREMQELKKNGIKSKLAASILILVFFSALAFSLTSNIMSIFPSTKCYRIAGGNGKTDPATGKCKV